MLMIGRGKEALVWSKSLARPFESDDSFIVKLAWINDVPEVNFPALERSVRENSGDYFAACSNYHQEWSLLRHPVGRALAREGLHICCDCIRAGFHSELPQLLGLEKCPIHARRFCRRCPRCLTEIQFGWPEFRGASLFLCGTCRSPLFSNGPSFLSDIEQLSDEQTLAAFRPFLSGLASAARKCAGYWHIHSRDAPRIYYYMTGYRDAFSPQSLRSSSILRGISVSDYTLPADPNELDLELRRLKSYDTCWLTMMAAESYQSGVKNEARMPLMKFRDDSIDYWRGTDLVKGAIAVQEQIEHYMAGDTRSFPADYLLPDSLLRRNDCLRQLRRIVVNCALRQIFKQLKFAEYIAAFHAGDEFNRNLDAKTERMAMLGSRLGNYSVNVIYKNHVLLRTPISSWLPSFHFQVLGAMLKLRVFRFGRTPTNLIQENKPSA